MDVTQNDSGASHIDIAAADAKLSESDSGVRMPAGEQVRSDIRRPAVWGLLVLIAVVLVLQLWLLF